MYTHPTNGKIPRLNQRVPFPSRAGLAVSAALFAAVLLGTGCAGAPETPPRSNPVAEILPEKAEADGPDRVRLSFVLLVSNPWGESAITQLLSYKVRVDGKDAGEAATAELEYGYLAPVGQTAYRGTSEVDLTSLQHGSGEVRKCDIELDLEWTFADGEKIRGRSAGEILFPRVKRPVFSIENITILQDNLINTSLKVTVRVHNPNHFPVQLSGFAYKLYGSGAFWADGVQKKIYNIEGRGNKSADLFLTMNFIGMDRALLDRVVQLRKVNYRFQGSVEISTGIEFLPVFEDSFDLSGESDVVK